MRLKFFATLAAGLLLASPSFSFYDSRLPQQPVPATSKINNTIARTVDARMSASGIPLSDARRGATMKALSKEATLYTKARGAGLAAGRRVPWAALLLGAALATDPTALFNLGETPPGKSEIGYQPSGAPTIGPTMSVPPTGYMFPPFYPVEVSTTERRTQCYVPGSWDMGGGTCWGSTTAACIACVVTRANKQRVAALGPKATVSFVGTRSAGGAVLNIMLRVNPYRRTDGVLAPATLLETAMSAQTGAWVPNVPSGGCESGAVWGTACINEFVENPPMITTEYDYPETLPNDSDYFDRPLSPAQLANLVNKLWRSAADRAGYSGVPYPLAEPVTTAEMQALRDAKPAIWPTVNDAWANTSPISTAPWFGDVPIPWNTGASTDPTYVPEPGVDVVVDGGGGSGGPVTVNVQVDAQVDLGADPGIGAPELEAPSAADIVAPAFGWFDVGDVELGAGECPRPTFDAFDKTFVIERHCLIVADNAAIISAIFVAFWTMCGAVVVLRA